MRWLVFQTVNGVTKQSVSLHTTEPNKKDYAGSVVKYDKVIEVDDTSSFTSLVAFHNMTSMESECGQEI